jgi:hypothetical protein
MAFRSSIGLGRARAGDECDRRLRRIQRTSRLDPHGAKNSPFAMSKCMRDNGVSNFPDPSAGPGGVGFNGVGISNTGVRQYGVRISPIRRSGLRPPARLSFPQTLIQSPVFQRAARACGANGHGLRSAGP